MSPPKPIPADGVNVRDSARVDFRKRHGKKRAEADRVWKSLVAKAPQLQADVHFGEYFLPPKRPNWLKDVHPLYVLKGLPSAFRAVYTVEYQSPGRGIVVIEWIGDHAEYDSIFGYSTS